MTFVVDASMTASWLLPDERSPLALKCHRAMEDETAFVPMIWRYEVWNLLAGAERRNRIPPSFTTTAIRLLTAYPIVEDNGAVADNTLMLARLHNLSVYDALYLELALRLALPLASLDRKLTTAASAAGVEVFA